MTRPVIVSVDPTACTAHGLCAELLPERIARDEWGYPLVDGTAVTGRTVAHAKRAAAACPALALRLRTSDSERTQISGTAGAHVAAEG